MLQTIIEEKANMKNSNYDNIFHFFTEYQHSKTTARAQA